MGLSDLERMINLCGSSEKKGGLRGIIIMLISIFAIIAFIIIALTLYYAVCGSPTDEKKIYADGVVVVPKKAAEQMEINDKKNNLVPLDYVSTLLKETQTESPTKPTSKVSEKNVESKGFHIAEVVEEAIVRDYDAPIEVEPGTPISKAKVEIPARTKLRARITEGFTNSEYTGRVIAIVLENYKEAKVKGATLIGSVQRWSENRAVIEFGLLITKDNNKYRINSHAGSYDGSLGIEILVNENRDKNILKDTAAIGVGFVKGVANYQTAGIAGVFIDETIGRDVDKIKTNTTYTLETDKEFYLVIDLPFEVIKD